MKNHSGVPSAVVKVPYGISCALSDTQPGGRRFVSAPPVWVLLGLLSQDFLLLRDAGDAFRVTADTCAVLKGMLFGLSFRYIITILTAFYGSIFFFLLYQHGTSSILFRTRKLPRKYSSYNLANLPDSSVSSNTPLHHPVVQLFANPSQSWKMLPSQMFRIQIPSQSR